MDDVLLSVSNNHVFFKGRPPVPASDLHRPFFWVFPEDEKDVNGLRRSLLKWVDEAKRTGQQREEDPLAGVVELGPVEEVESFWRGSIRFRAFRVYTRHPGLVPKISDEVFRRLEAFTGEHDVPYQQRLGVDMAAQGNWPFATGGKKTTLDVMVFDIETTQYGNKGVKETDSIPVDVIGYAHFPFTYQAKVDLETEEFDLDIIDAPQDWRAPEIVQEVARNIDEEIDLLANFATAVKGVDVVSGHNVLGFDNLKIHERMSLLLERGRKNGSLERSKEQLFSSFLDTYLWKDRTYQFGRPDDIAVLHPATFDTLLAARRFYFFLDDFTLKGLAPFIGVNVEDRQYVEAHALDLMKQETLTYHLHDVQEQLGLSMHLMVQAIPLAFSTGMTFEQLFQGMNTKMWDHIGLIRSAYRKRIAPATCRAQAIASTIQRRLHSTPTKAEIARYARGLVGEADGGQSARELLRVAKYGPEMPEWVEYPHLISDVTENAQDPHGYAIPGGMTLHPSELKSEFVPWWHVVAADVGAMYPTILKALNVGADTVRIALKDETPDEWVWLYRVSPEIVDSGAYAIRKPGEDEDYAERGVMVGIKKRDEPGVVNLGMTAILGMIAKVKRALAVAKAPGSGASPEDIKRLQLNYASLKAARNAGTHGILVAVNVSCRQFNVLAGAHITTEGQRILHESLKDLKQRGIRVVYGDTDGIYLACGKNGANIDRVAEVYGAHDKADPAGWMTRPEEAVEAVEALNERFRTELNYQDFELEPEVHDAMVFVVHKNYLIFDAYEGELKMETKGNNFKGSDKAELARQELAQIMYKTMGENLVWKDEEAARKGVQMSIKRATVERIQKIQVSTVDPIQLVLLQTVRPARNYKPNPDGTPSSFAKRSEALDDLLRKSGLDGLSGTRKFKFVVANRPLPGLETAGRKKSGIKPIEYMWPVDVLQMKQWRDAGYRIDLDWYKEMIENYVRGAFGFDDLSTVEQKGLDAWL